MGQMLMFLTRASEVARGSGWLIALEDDESLTFAADTYAYSVPATFAYVDSLRIEDDSRDTSTYETHIPRTYWEMRIDDSVPKFFFDPRMFSIPADKKMKVIGQSRPTLYSALTDTIDPGMEAFLTERATHFALSYMSAGNPTLDIDRSRLDLSRTSLAISERLLSNHPQEYRMRPNARVVPGR